MDLLSQKQTSRSRSHLPPVYIVSKDSWFAPFDFVVVSLETLNRQKRERQKAIDTAMNQKYAAKLLIAS